MSASFVLNYDKLSDPMFGAFVEGLRGEPCIDSSETFNRFCRQACLLWNQQFGAAPASTSVRFSELLERIDRRSEGAIPTTWGGVVVVRYEHPQVEKDDGIGRGPRRTGCRSIANGLAPRPNAAAAEPDELRRSGQAAGKGRVPLRLRSLALAVDKQLRARHKR
jgi:hypothetical protein